jgi:hypothetical protein
MVSQTYNTDLTKEEMEKIKEATNDIGKYGTLEIIKNNGVIDIIKSERIRIRDGKPTYHRG